MDTVASPIAKSVSLGWENTLLFVASLNIKNSIVQSPASFCPKSAPANLILVLVQTLGAAVVAPNILPHPPEVS